MTRGGPFPDPGTYSTKPCVLGWRANSHNGDEQWQRAATLIRDMRTAKTEPAVVSYATGTNARKKGKQWQRALSLPSDTWASKVGHAVISCG